MCFASAEMRRLIVFLSLLLSIHFVVNAQSDFQQISNDGTIRDLGPNRSDTLHASNKEVLQGIHTWTVDERFGDRRAVAVDTIQHMFMNTVFTSGLRGEYNMTGNYGSPRINRIFTDRPLTSQFMFTQPYDFFITPVEDFHFTNTFSPLTNLTYYSCGDKNNGEDRVKALFAVNVNKQAGVGFKFDYLYGRGYYQNQSTAHFNFSLYGSYVGDRYQAHLLFTTNHQKAAENGGITDENYVTHPESYETDFRTNEIPTFLNKNWNRLDHHHVFLTHRYNVGFNRKIPMTEEEIKAKKFAMESQKENEKKEKKGKDSKLKDDEQPKVYAGRPDDAKIIGDEPANVEQAANNRITVNGKEAADSLLALDDKKKEEEWTKNEYVPVTSFIHTMKLDINRRIYQAYDTPADYYSYNYPVVEELTGDSIYDRMKHFNLKNTFSISLLEGFNKWAKAGLKAFITSDLRKYEMPDTLSSGFSSFNEHTLSVGGQLSKTQGSLLHYNVTAETWLIGEDAGQFKLDASADLNFKFLGDSLKLEAKGYLYNLNPTFFQRKFHSKHVWWDHDFDKETRTRLEGMLTYRKTRTSIRVAMDNLKNYVYFSNKYTTDKEKRYQYNVSINQHSENITLLTVQLNQDFTLGPLNWETQLTYQKCSNNQVLPVPDMNLYSNLYLHFKIAHVLTVDLGADVRFFTSYTAPDYSPLIQQYCVQDNGENNIKIGKYPIVNAYANMHLKRTRFFVMMSHLNAGLGGDPFLVPNHPLNERIFRFGVSWNFAN